MGKSGNGGAVEEISSTAPRKADQNGQPERAHVKNRGSCVRRLLGIVLRLFIWYVLGTTVLYCPTSISEIDDTSSRVCKPYLIARSRLEPHITPYYEVYGAPYVEIVHPYAQKFHEWVYVPAATASKQSYRVYAAPRIERGLNLAEKTWHSTATPRLQEFQDRILQSYDSSIQPHIAHAESIVAPHYQRALVYGTIIKDDYFIPYYIKLKPAFEGAYSSFHGFTTNTVVPYTRKASSSLFTFVNGTLRAQITRLYFENVEPQLVRIGNKLASYREGRALKGGPEDTEGVVDVTGLTTTPESTAKSVEPEATSISTTSETPSQTSLTPSEKAGVARERIASDLKSWQERFAVAADKGCDDLEEQVSQAVQSEVDRGSQLKGDELVSALETVTQRELSALKSTINDLVRSIPENATLKDEENALAELLLALKSSGSAIRESAHALRKWFNEYDSRLVSHVDAAVTTTLDVLDNIRDLGLQEIGMRWAWMDGVTYKDWAKFHALKERFSEWRKEVREVGTTNSALLNAREIGDNILAKGMDVAEGAARELSKLKDVGKFKIQAGDASDKFEVGDLDTDEIRSRRSVMSAIETSSTTSPTTSEPSVSSVELPSVEQDTISSHLPETEADPGRSSHYSGELDDETLEAGSVEQPLAASSAPAETAAQPLVDEDNSADYVEASGSQSDSEKETTSNDAPAGDVPAGPSVESAPTSHQSYDDGHVDSDPVDTIDKPSASTQTSTSQEFDALENTASPEPVLDKTESHHSVQDDPVTTATPLSNVPVEPDMSESSESYSTDSKVKSDDQEGEELLADILRRRDEMVANAFDHYSKAMESISKDAKTPAASPSADVLKKEEENDDHIISSSSASFDDSEEANLQSTDAQSDGAASTSIAANEDPNDVNAEEVLTSVITKFDALVDSTKAEIQDNIPLTYDTITPILDTAIANLNDISLSAQSTLNSIEGSAHQHGITLESAFTMLQSSFEDAQTRLLELSKLSESEAVHHSSISATPIEETTTASDIENAPTDITRNEL